VGVAVAPFWPPKESRGGGKLSVGETVCSKMGPVLVHDESLQGEAAAIAEKEEEEEEEVDGGEGEGEVVDWARAKLVKFSKVFCKAMGAAPTLLILSDPPSAIMSKSRSMSP